MRTVVKLIGLYVVCAGAVAGCFVVLAIGRASWGEVGPLVSAVVLGLAGIHASALVATPGASSGRTPPATPRGESTPAGIGSAGSHGQAG